MASKAKPRRGDRHRFPQTAMRLQPALVKAAKHAAIDEGRSLRALIEDAVDQYLKKTAR